MSGVLLTKWTIRLALVCYVACVAGWLSLGPARQPRIARAIWTLGCVLFDVHVACAFHFYHHWSHANAWQHTAERTRELLGIAVGDGIYFSYLFLFLWLLDVVWLWVCPLTDNKRVANGTPNTGRPPGSATAGAMPVPQPSSQLPRTPVLRAVVHIFLLFVAVNGAIIFEAGVTRWAGIAAGLALAYPAVGRGYNFLRSRKANGPHEAIHEAADEFAPKAACDYKFVSDRRP
jgi:hypothetical protein